MFRARSASPKPDLSASLTHNIASYLACGPLKLPEVMGALLGRSIAPEQKVVYARGYELVTVPTNGSGLPKRRNPIFIPNPSDFNVISFALYNDLTQRELRIIAQYNGVGIITEAVLETSEFENHSLKHLVHRLREGVHSTAYYFPTEDEVVDEFEMEHMLIDTYVKEAKIFKKRLDQCRQQVEGAYMSLRSRR